MKEGKVNVGERMEISPSNYMVNLVFFLNFFSFLIQML
jgi:hypothetical protein